MKKNLILLLLFLCLWGGQEFAGQKDSKIIEADALNVFLHSPRLSDRRAAYLDIINNREQYVDQIRQGLETFARTKDQRFDILNKYIYLAAIIRADGLYEPLAKLVDDYAYLWAECIYCCPIVFACTLYAVFEESPPPATWREDLAWNTMLGDLSSGIARLLEMKNKPLVRNLSGIQFADPKKQEWLEGLEALSVAELIKMTEPENAETNERYFGAQVLAGKVLDDKNLTELYWLVIEDLPRDASGIYRCSIYHAIERAEIARARGKK